MDPVRYHTDEPLSFLREWLEMHPPVASVRAETPSADGVSSKSAGTHRTTRVTYGADGQIEIRPQRSDGAQVEMFKRAG
jgi:hypothetical protein